MKLSDRTFERQIAAYFEGALSERERARFEKRLRESEACRRELEAFRRLRELSAPPRVEYPSDYAMSQFLPRLHARIERGVLFRSRRGASWLQNGLLGLGFVEAAAAMLLLVWGLQTGRRPAETPTVAEPETVAASPVSETEPIRVIAETWVTPKLAARLATINPDSGTSAYPSEALEPAASETADAAAPTGEAVMNTPTAETVVAASESYRRLIEVALPPSGIYGEEASYLLASRR